MCINATHESRRSPRVFAGEVNCIIIEEFCHLLAAHRVHMFQPLGGYILPSSFAQYSMYAFGDPRIPPTVSANALEAMSQIPTADADWSQFIGPRRNLQTPSQVCLAPLWLLRTTKPPLSFAQAWTSAPSHV